MSDEVLIKVSKNIKEIIDEIIEKANKEAPDLELNYTDFLDFVQDSFYEEIEISFEGLMNYYGYEAYTNKETGKTTYHEGE